MQISITKTEQAYLVLKFAFNGSALITSSSDDFASKNPFKVSTRDRLPFVYDKCSPVGFATVTKGTHIKTAFFRVL